MATAFMGVDNTFKPKFIKLLKTWDENKIFPDAKIHEVRDTMMLMLTNGGVFPAHLASAGPQMGGRPHMAQGPMDVETPYATSHDSYHNQHNQQHGGMTQHQQHQQHHYNMGGHTDNDPYAANRSSSYESYGGDTPMKNERPSNSPTLCAADVPEYNRPRTLCPKELAR
jgi:hypothetical protein